MGFTIKTRYGAKESFEDGAAAPEVVGRLIEELSTEEFEEPDDEHTQVAVSFGRWALTAQVSGLLTLDDPAARPLYLRAASRGQVRDLLIAMAEGRIDAVRRVGWVEFEQIPPFERDLFRE